MNLSKNIIVFVYFVYNEKLISNVKIIFIHNKLKADYVILLF